jgi:hypothetical protein
LQIRECLRRKNLFHTGIILVDHYRSPYLFSCLSLYLDQAKG